ncbi:MAG: hypothetical protein WB698_01825 [Solirubrobacteraceae bacterium]
MGTSGSYSGSGGKVGERLREDVSNWLDSLPSPQTGQGDNGDQNQGDQGRPRLNPEAILPIVGLLRPRSGTGGGSDGPGGGSGGTGGTATGRGGRSGGGPHRTVARSAGTAGRAAAAAYAYRSGDASTLERLGLNFAELTTLGDQYEIARRIAYAACASADSTIEDHEQRLVAAEVAEWVLNPDGEPPTPEEIVRHTIGLIIADALLSETGELVNNSNYADLAESEVRDAADALASRASLSVDGVTDEQFTQAIENGIETLRSIYEGNS